MDADKLKKIKKSENNPPNPLPKTFNRIFPLRGRSTKDVKTSNITGSALSGEKLILKVLGKEFEEEPFFKRVFLNRHV